jgi:hypothetical protein
VRNVEEIFDGKTSSEAHFGNLYIYICIRAYAPTEDKSDDMKDSFYEELE